MKKIISLMTVVAMVVSMSSLTAFATNTRTVTLTTTVESANTGDEFDAIATLDTSNTVKTLGFKIAFDPNDIELGVSAESKATIAEYESYIGTADFPTADSVTEAVLGRKSYVSDTYASTYGNYASTKNLGAATIGYEVKDGLGQVGFAYAINTAKNALNKIDNMVVGGAVLKVKTTEAKQTTIKLVSTSTSDSSNTQYVSTVNEVVLNLNGYDPNGGDDDTVTATKTEGTNVDEYTFTNSDDMAGKRVLMTKATTAGSTISDKTRFKVTYDTQEPRIFGSDIWDKLAQGAGSISVGTVKFGIVVTDNSLDAAKFTFEVITLD